MKFKNPISIEEISSFLKLPFFGDGSTLIYGLNEINRCTKGDVIFVNHPKYLKKAESSNATAIITTEHDKPSKKVTLVSENPFDDFNRLIKKFKPSSNKKLSYGKNTFIHPSVVIGNNVIIGNNCVIHPNVVLYNNISIGDNTIIHANSVIGANAFYYNKKQNTYSPLITCGEVVIGDFVEIGANNTIDAGVTDKTKIGNGTKTDNLVHIGHDTIIGKNCLIAAQVGIAGCNIIEDNVTLWGQVGTPSNITIGEGAVILGKSGPFQNVEANETIFGVPGINAKQRFREILNQRKLTQIIKKLDL
mgnify:FL=1